MLFQGLLEVKNYFDDKKLTTLVERSKPVKQPKVEIITQLAIHNIKQKELAKRIGEREDETSRAINGGDAQRFKRIRKKIFDYFQIN